jgi:hypothetical protein
VQQSYCLGIPLLDPYVTLTHRDRLELLAFEARLAGLPESLIQALWEAVEAALPSDFFSSPLPKSARTVGRGLRQLS